MASVSVRIHSTQFPDAVRRDLLESLRRRKINHKFHYDSVKQTQKWLALHQAYSPSRTDADCVATYEKCFREAARIVDSDRVHLVGLGCGGGQKDARLLYLLKKENRQLFYTPSDVSVAMVLVAQHAAAPIVAPGSCFPFVCDLAYLENSASCFSVQAVEDAQRLITFFGMIPNFEPQQILPILTALLRPSDLLLFSANLSPDADYASGVSNILPLYDNELTRDWLLSFLWDLGFEKTAGDLRFSIEDVDYNDTILKRIVGDFTFSASCSIQILGEEFNFSEGETIRLFYSFRHTPGLISQMLEAYGIQVLNQWITRSKEEGVFLCRKNDQ